jgi:hypothetical protein
MLARPPAAFPSSSFIPSPFLSSSASLTSASFTSGPTILKSCGPQRTVTTGANEKNWLGTTTGARSLRTPQYPFISDRQCARSPTPRSHLPRRRIGPHGDVDGMPGLSCRRLPAHALALKVGIFLATSIDAGVDLNTVVLEFIVAITAPWPVGRCRQLSDHYDLWCGILFLLRR